MAGLLSQAGAGAGLGGTPAGPPDPTAGGPGPEELLAQIRTLLDQYLALGADTPVAQEAQMLADAIDETTGQDQSPQMGDMAGDQETPTEDSGEVTEEPPPSTGAKTFGQANKNASKRLKRRNQLGSKG